MNAATDLEEYRDVKQVNMNYFRSRQISPESATPAPTQMEVDALYEKHKAKAKATNEKAKARKERARTKARKGKERE